MGIRFSKLGKNCTELDVELLTQPSASKCRQSLFDQLLNVLTGNTAQLTPSGGTSEIDR